MDKQELDLLEKFALENPELKALWDDHLIYEKKIESLEHKKILTPEEQQSLKQLKKQKLEGKTRLMHILDELKKTELK